MNTYAPDKYAPPFQRLKCLRIGFGREGGRQNLMLIFSILNMNAEFHSETLVSSSNSIHSHGAEEHLQP